MTIRDAVNGVIVAATLATQAGIVASSAPAIFERVPEHTEFRIIRTNEDVLHVVAWPVVTIDEDGDAAVDWASVERDVAATPPKVCLTRNYCVLELLISRVRAGKVKDLSRGSK